MYNTPTDHDLAQRPDNHGSPRERDATSETLGECL